MAKARASERVAVVIPSYKVTRHVLQVISQIGSECCRIYVVDDCCPDGSGRFVQTHCTDPRGDCLVPRGESGGWRCCHDRL